jgi:hypothetical protein
LGKRLTEVLSWGGVVKYFYPVQKCLEVSLKFLKTESKNILTYFYKMLTKNLTYNARLWARSVDRKKTRKRLLGNWGCAGEGHVDPWTRK